jgi:hypothetical protein
VAINPTRELVDELKRDPDLSSRALIVVERKDVIYQIPPSVTVLDG